jgi:hypothetical protein
MININCFATLSFISSVSAGLPSLGSGIAEPCSVRDSLAGRGSSIDARRDAIIEE